MGARHHRDLGPNRPSFQYAVIWTITAPAITDATMIEVAWPRW